ncbi:putative negative regulator of dna transposition protein [Lasiodiplodia theobromae]|uniref:Negative regulator of DNA transposition protein n=1 Tax=Lasiodiplodia theobromae TaxID=45133 RepID=UPI0015C38B76|nr:Negative regulator of DNA transposition protein [Lasiodiplodia theobromae]KAF4535726.1 Negative regulator of DNA transposition protein [Lasiodiplodia theobromae]KAF9637248.1 putative negative regulator of dna transposition protein [Lasiodiplodia theobromae]
MSQFTAFSSRPTAAAAPPSAPPQTVPIPAPAPESLPEVEQAFADQPELKKRVYSAIGESPQHQPLFSSISSYILQLRQNPPPSTLATNGATASRTDEPATKKRKIEGGAEAAAGAGTIGAWTNSAAGADFTLPDVSFSIPQRKKLHLQLVAASGAGDSSGGGLRACSGGGANVEFGIGFRDVEQVFCLPIPEKAKRQWNFIIIPKGNDGLSTAPEGTTPPEQIVWTFQEPTKKELEGGAETGPEFMAERLNGFLTPFGKKVVFPTKEEFQSTIPQSHLKGEPGFHVKAFRGSKEGFLFLTSVGIVFGFKKPLVYFSFGSVESISYTSVLQRTFNLNITINASGPEQKSQEIEFSMLDQADYTGIDQYIKHHGLNDASMAAQRKAQMYNVNGPEEGQSEDVAAAGDGETELEKAQRMLEDEEDEDEEDYDPGSEGESEGSGTSSDEDSDEDEEEGYEGDEGDEGNLVQDELGSEAEDVQLTDEE